MVTERHFPSSLNFKEWQIGILGLIFNGGSFDEKLKKKKKKAQLILVSVYAVNQTNSINDQFMVYRNALVFLITTLKVGLR